MKPPVVVFALVVIAGVYTWWHQAQNSEPEVGVWISDKLDTCGVVVIGQPPIRDVLCAQIGQRIQTQLGLPPGTRIQVSAKSDVESAKVRVVTDSLNAAGYLVAGISNVRREGFVTE